PLRAKHLRDLCAYLSIPATISTSIDRVVLEQINNKLAQDAQRLAPILLLDYEYYEDITLALSPQINIDHKNINDENKLEKLANKTRIDIDKQQALNSLLSNTALPKILVSMKAERRIPSMLLDQCDGFLNKPLDVALLLSELLRLTLPVRQT
ncbi:hypothetical protein, partial [Klebsiella pneumoniae]|uniref:hypothetical protein n=1 Tax=Klebsiella pneumoniae TaxID=573 RepID=UPI0010276D30